LPIHSLHFLSLMCRCNVFFIHPYLAHQDWV
jgi:hypothetical protein